MSIILMNGLDTGLANEVRDRYRAENLARAAEFVFDYVIYQSREGTNVSRITLVGSRGDVTSVVAGFIYSRLNDASNTTNLSCLDMILSSSNEPGNGNVFDVDAILMNMQGRDRR